MTGLVLVVLVAVLYLVATVFMALDSVASAPLTRVWAVNLASTPFVLQVHITGHPLPSGASHWQPSQREVLLPPTSRGIAGSTYSDDEGALRIVVMNSGCEVLRVIDTNLGFGDVIWIDAKGNPMQLDQFGVFGDDPPAEPILAPTELCPSPTPTASP